MDGSVDEGVLLLGLDHTATLRAHGLYDLGDAAALTEHKLLDCDIDGDEGAGATYSSATMRDQWAQQSYTIRERERERERERARVSDVAAPIHGE